MTEKIVQIVTQELIKLANKVTAAHRKDATEREVEKDSVILDPIELPDMYVPGTLLHFYSHHGVYRAARVPKDFPSLQEIIMQGNMLSDHKALNYFNALCEVIDVRNAVDSPPTWQSFKDSNKCSCCKAPFTWNSTSDSEAQMNRDKHNCRACGKLVCHPCSEKRNSIPSIGLSSPARICDACFYTGSRVLK